VALTYRDADKNRALYINGVRDEGGSIYQAGTTLYFPNMEVMHLGGGFKGILDEVRIYNQALSANQIAYLYADTTLHATSIRNIIRRISEGEVKMVLPNPAYSLDMVRANPALYRIYDLAGRPMAIGAVKNSGIYLLEFVSKREVQKVILLNK
jgi:hypothetical protein